ncbi:hypothetical protein KC19_1G296800 [Ceratodon purpureus]|uniref:J domain-containing protein n=1 Tax=Ceratodon purpureus TaxID=3225 RepID=A0A8T0JB54_CERPU|nr:hypothetical protein KC19_1G296800 [Ceratodon purpureus]KAG0592998.1 hypothetical protein KC19_1G296800 [Ceratodon purpureus]
MDREDLYDVLHLKASGPQVKNCVIRKAYHKRALVLHPDKRGNDPVAAEEFQKVQQAYEILNDDKLRATYDDLQRVRELRLRKEITQCDKKLEERLNSETRDESYRMLGRRPTIVDHNGELNVRLGDYVRSFRFASDISSEDDTTIKASWTCKEGERDYSEIQLKEIFKEYGEVIEAVKSRRKSFAIIVMGSKDASDAAIKGNYSKYCNSFKVMPTIKSRKVNYYY